MTDETGRGDPHTGEFPLGHGGQPAGPERFGTGEQRPPLPQWGAPEPPPEAATGEHRIPGRPPAPPGTWGRWPPPPPPPPPGASGPIGGPPTGPVPRFDPTGPGGEGTAPVFGFGLDPAGPGGPHEPGAAGSEGAPPPRRGVPMGVVLVVTLVVAVVAGGMGGYLGSTLESESATTTGSNLDDTNIPEDTPVRPADTVAGVAQRVSPSVVSIQSTNPLDAGNGSGFVISDDYVVTNNHVAAALDGADGIEVIYSDGHSSQASIVGAAPAFDIAVLELADPLDVDPLGFGDSDQVTVGDTVIAIGAPLGLEGTVTTGIISAMDRPVTVGGDGDEQSFMSALQTDAAINPGNSGGPLVDQSGNVIGVNTAIATLGVDEVLGQQSGSIGLGFAIPSNQVARVADQLIETGSAPYAVMGVVPDLTYQGQGARIMDEPAGQMEPVTPDGPADEAGLEPGDIIIDLNGTTITDATQMITVIRSHAPGEEVTVTFLRGNEELNATVTLDGVQ